MTLSEQTEKKVYDKLRAFDGIEVAGHEPVDSSIASVLSEGEVLADDGNQYSSIQDAVDASDGWTFVGPGTYYENVVIDKDDFMLQGAGYDTLIDGGTVGDAVKITGKNVSIKSLRAKTSDPRGDGSGFKAIHSLGNKTTINSVSVPFSGSTAINTAGDDVIITNSIVESSATWGIRTGGAHSIIRGCKVSDTSESSYSYGRNLQTGGDNSIISGCISIRSGNHGINVNGSDNVIIANRVHEAGSNTADGSSAYGIRINAKDVIVANNRVSNSKTGGINDAGTGTVVEGNLTGASN